MTIIIRAVALAVFAIGLLAGSNVAGQTTGPRTPPLVIESMYGPDLYRLYCATCHGRDARGGGPAASALKVPPPDLTVLARRQNGVYPAFEVETIIRGSDAMASHGSDEMPVWGPIFKALDPADARVKARIRSLVEFIGSIQQR
jgi:mono/diheme cytochrome c family protein